MRAVMDDYTRADLAAPDRAMLDYAIKLTRSPEEMIREDVQALRAHGFTDDAIQEITQITALFAYYNRIADGLGIDGEADGRSTPGT